MNKEMVLKVENLCKDYGALTVLDHVNLAIAKGEIVAVIGPSGGGKTTLLRMIDMLEPADQGVLWLNGTTIDLARPEKKAMLAVRRQIGFVFQQYNLFSHRTVKQNIMDTLRYGHGYAKADAQRRAVEVLAMVDLSDQADQYPITLSGGQSQRAAIARAIASTPAVLILDEPTSALDPELTGEVAAVIANLAKRGMTMLLVTHHIRLAADVADRVIVLADGGIVEEGTADAVLRSPQAARTKSFLARVHQVEDNALQR